MMKFTAPRPTGVLRVATRSPYVETDAEQCWLYRRDSGEFGERHGVRHGVLLAGQPRHPGHAAHPGDDVVGRRGGDDVVRRVPRRVRGGSWGGAAKPRRENPRPAPGRLPTVGSSSIPGSRRTGSGWGAKGPPRRSPAGRAQAGRGGNLPGAVPLSRTAVLMRWRRPSPTGSVVGSRRANARPSGPGQRAIRPAPRGAAGWTPA